MPFSPTLSISMQPGTDGKVWVLDDDFEWETPYGVTIALFAGFEFDGASIPRLFWRVIGPPLAGPYAPAAAIHDLLYNSEIVERKVADCLFEAAMEELGVSRWKRFLMHKAVRLGGGFSWKHHTDESVTKARRFISMSASPYLLDACGE
jgi:hypothetical protein